MSNGYEEKPQGKKQESGLLDVTWGGGSLFR
jgi:hypothetical protein